jgi:hypothetical protein
LEDGPEKILNKHLEALHDNRISEAYSYTASKFQSAVPFSDFRELLKANRVLTSYADMQILQRDFRENEALISTSLGHPDGGKTFLKYFLAKEGRQRPG